MVLFVVLAMLQLAFTMHTRFVITAAAEDAVRVAAAYDGDTVAGERRFRALLADEINPGIVESLTWAGTLDTLTLRVRSRLPLLGPLGPVAMTVDASAYHEAWA